MISKLKHSGDLAQLVTKIRGYRGYLGPVVLLSHPVFTKLVSLIFTKTTSVLSRTVRRMTQNDYLLLFVDTIFYQSEANPLLHPPRDSRDPTSGYQILGIESPQPQESAPKTRRSLILILFRDAVFSRATALSLESSSGHQRERTISIKAFCT